MSLEPIAGTRLGESPTETVPITVRSRPAGEVSDTSTLRSGTMTVAASAVTLISNLGTGVLLARVLGTSGRGATAAILTATQIFAWVFLIGSSQTISFFQARDSDRGGVLLGTWLVLVVPLSLAALGLGELLVPTVMAAQSPHTIQTARLFMVTVALVLVTELIAGYIAGNQRFVLFNALRTLTPMTVALVYVALWANGDLSVASAVWSYAVVQAASMVLAVGLCGRWHGINRPDWAFAREMLWYGVRAHSTNISTLLTARLDLLIMPSFLSASRVGLYSVATNVSWIVFVLSGSLAIVVLPIATKAGSDGPRVIIRSLQGTALVAVVLALGIAAVAGFAVRAAYGGAFVPCLDALRLLLPGSVLYAMALVLVSGLYAANRPFLAAMTQAVGLLVTVVGLSLFLESGGIVAAAVVSTVSYSAVFIVAIVTYSRVAQLNWRSYLTHDLTLRGWIRHMGARCDSLRGSRLEP